MGKNENFTKIIKNIIDNRKNLKLSLSRIKDKLFDSK